MKHGITGKINVGKSFFASQIKKIMQYQVIEVDDIRRHILWTSVKKEHIEMRQSLANFFGMIVSSDECWLNQEILTTKIFSNSENLYAYSSIATPLIKKYVENIQEKNSFLVWALLLEEGYDSLCDGKIIEVIDTTNRGHDNDVIKMRLERQVHFPATPIRTPDVVYNHTDIKDFIRKNL